jgi:hypothetical protein
VLGLVPAQGDQAAGFTHNVRPIRFIPADSWMWPCSAAIG